MITAYHVYEKAKIDKLDCYLNGKLFPSFNKPHDYDKHLDIATFIIDEKFIQDIKIQVIELTSKDWPPQSPQEGRGIFFCGFPGLEVRQSADFKSIDFGSFIYLGAINSVSDRNITIFLDPNFLIPDGNEPPANYQYGGISGAPALALYYKPGDFKFRYWDFAGIVYENHPRDNYFKLRPACLINNDGTIKKDIHIV